MNQIRGHLIGVRQLPLAWLVASVVMTILTGCGSSPHPSMDSRVGSDEHSPLGSHVQSIPTSSHLTAEEKEGNIAVPWQVIGPRGDGAVEIRSNRGYCVNRESPPKFEAAEISYQGSDAYIKAFVPARQSAPKGTICSDIGYVQLGRIELRRKLEDLRLFDGSVRPPAIRWVRGQIVSSMGVRSAPQFSGLAKAQKPQSRNSEVSWRLSSVVNAQSIRILSHGGFCEGDRPTEFARPGVQEKGATVTIVASVVEYPSNGEPCRGLGQVFEKTLTLRQPVRQVTIYDGSTKPPSRRWPHG
jgi:hypothetical protein